jgi:hypothetical protein
MTPFTVGSTIISGYCWEVLAIFYSTVVGGYMGVNYNVYANITGFPSNPEQFGPSANGIPIGYAGGFSNWGIQVSDLVTKWADGTYPYDAAPVCDYGYIGPNTPCTGEFKWRACQWPLTITGLTDAQVYCLEVDWQVAAIGSDTWVSDTNLPPTFICFTAVGTSYTTALLDPFSGYTGSSAMSALLAEYPTTGVKWRIAGYVITPVSDCTTCGGGPPPPPPPFGPPGP